MLGLLAVFGVHLPLWAAIPGAAVAAAGVVFSLTRDRSEPPADGPVIREREFF